jgi:Tetratricopeptide repeat/FG-GAP repeat/FG-GAP-like repeat
MRSPLGAALLVACLLAPLRAQESRPATEQAALVESAKLMQQGAYAEAAALLERLVAAEPENAQAWFRLGYCRHALGDLQRALAAHERAACFPEVAATASYNAACAHARLGHVDEAFAWLERARTAGFTGWAALATDADLDALREDPRFAAFLPAPADTARPFVEDATILYDLFGEAAGDQFGWVARAVGDVDADGAADFASTAPFAAQGAGAVYVYSGRKGALLFRADGRPGEQLGWCVSGAGDVDGDGHADVVAGAPGAAGGTGAVHVLSGADGSVLRTLRGEDPGDRFGTDARAVGDHDGDGVPELLIGAPEHDAAGADAGRAYFVSGRAGEVVHTFDGERAGDELGGGELAGFCKGADGLLVVAAMNAGDEHRGRVYAWSAASRELRFTLAGDGGSKNLGWFVSIPGDLDRDGTPDVLATDWHDSAGGPGFGRAWVWSGADGRVLLDLKGRAPGECFGIGSCEAGDLDRDGVPDLAVGAWQSSAGAPAGGRVYLLSGRDGSALGTLTGRIPGDALGFDATSVGDADGDGVPDLLVTAAYNGAKGVKAGRAYVVSGKSALVRGGAR